MILFINFWKMLGVLLQKWRDTCGSCLVTGGLPTSVKVVSTLLAIITLIYSRFAFDLTSFCHDLSFFYKYCYMKRSSLLSVLGCSLFHFFVFLFVSSSTLPPKVILFHNLPLSSLRFKWVPTFDNSWEFFFHFVQFSSSTISIDFLLFRFSIQ